MAYRSEVVMLIVGEPQNITAFATYIRLAYPEVAKHVFGENGFLRKVWGEYTVLQLYEPETKWYDHDKDVAAFERAWELAEGLGLTGAFLRLGQDDTDIELRGFGDIDLSGLVSLHRGIALQILEDENPTTPPSS